MGGGQCAVAGLLRESTVLVVTHRQEIISHWLRDELIDGATS